MIEINLLPEELRKKKRTASAIDVSKIDLKGFPVAAVASTAIGGLIAVQVVVFFIGIMGGTNNKALAKNYKDIFPTVQETEKLRVQVAAMAKKVSAIDELMVKRFRWARKLDALSDSIIPGIWLTEMGYYEKSGEALKPVAVNLLKKKGESAAAQQTMEKVVLKYLTISGMALSVGGEEGTALVGQFIKSLKSNTEFYSDFSDIELGTITREKSHEQEVMKFSITCPFKIKR